jgi:hypothetical protein
MFARLLAPFGRLLFGRPICTEALWPRALAQGVFKNNRSIVLLQELGEGFVSQLLECFHLIPCETPSRFAVAVRVVAHHERAVDT